MFRIPSAARTCGAIANILIVVSWSLLAPAAMAAEPRSVLELNFNDDKEGKPVGIQMHIGRRPILAFGNSDGDLQMLQ